MPLLMQTGAGRMDKALILEPARSVRAVPCWSGKGLIPHPCSATGMRTMVQPV